MSIQRNLTISPGYVNADISVEPGPHMRSLTAWRFAGWRFSLWHGWYLRLSFILERHGLRFQIGPLIVARSFEAA